MSQQPRLFCLYRIQVLQGKPPSSIKDETGFKASFGVSSSIARILCQVKMSHLVCCCTQDTSGTIELSPHRTFSKKFHSPSFVVYNIVGHGHDPSRPVLSFRGARVRPPRTLPRVPWHRFPIPTPSILLIPLSHWVKTKRNNMHKIHPGHNQIRFYQSTIDQKSGALLLLLFSFFLSSCFLNDDDDDDVFLFVSYCDFLFVRSFVRLDSWFLGKRVGCWVFSDKPAEDLRCYRWPIDPTRWKTNGQLQLLCSLAHT